MIRAPDSPQRTDSHKHRQLLKPLEPWIMLFIMVAPMASRGTSTQNIRVVYLSVKLRMYTRTAHRFNTDAATVQPK